MTIQHLSKAIYKYSLVLCSSLILGACSHGVLSLPPASVSYFENEYKTGAAVRIETWGISIDTNMDSGLSMGHIVKTYFYEGTASKFAGNSLEKIDEPLIEVKSSNVSDLTGASPYAYTVMSEGLLLNANAHRTGVNLGVSAYERVYLPSGFDGLLFMKTKLGAKNPGKFYIKRVEVPK